MIQQSTLDIEKLFILAELSSNAYEYNFYNVQDTEIKQPPFQ